MQYGQIDTTYFERNGYTGTVSHEAIGVALGMPSVERSGQPAQRGGLKAPGLGTYYHALSLNWAAAGVDGGLRDVDFFNATAGCTDKRPGNPSNKQNHLHGLQAAGLVVITRRNGMYFTALTDAGVAQCKSVNPDLGKVAKAFTMKALNKAFEAAAKAQKPVKARKAKAEVPPAELEAVLAEVPPVAPEAATEATESFTG